MSSAINRILVSIKYPNAETPLSVLKAAQLARGLHAELMLFHAIDTPLYVEAHADIEPEAGGDESNIRERSLHGLAIQAASLKQEGISITVAAEWDYPAHEAALRHAHRLGADLIVTERHASGSANPHSLHSADWELLRLSSKPVLIVKDEDGRAYQQPVIVAALDPSHRHAKPAGLDRDICALAQVFSTSLDGSWYALHAYAVGPDPSPKRRSTDGIPTEDLRRAKAFGAVTQVLQSGALQPRAVLLRADTPAEAIIEATRELSASLLVMGGLSRSGIKRLLIGNTAEQVIDRVSCDVLVVKPERFGLHFSHRMQGAKRIP